MIYQVLIVVIFSYFIASIPCGLVLSQIFGYGDLRKVGSGNIGATNAFRAGGKKLGILTLLLDVLKGVLPLIIFKVLNYDPELMAIAGVFLVVGHIFSVWLGFKGGKGVATALAVLLVLTPYLGITFIVLWIMVFSVFRIVSLASLSALATVVILGFWYTPAYFAMVMVISILVFYKHKANIGRIIRGEEPSFKSRG